MRELPPFCSTYKDGYPVLTERALMMRPPQFKPKHERWCSFILGTGVVHSFQPDETCEADCCRKRTVDPPHVHTVCPRADTTPIASSSSTGSGPQAWSRVHFRRTKCAGVATNELIDGNLICAEFVLVALPTTAVPTL